MNSIVKVDDPKSNDPVVVRVYILRLLQSMTEEERERQKNQPSLINRPLELEVLRKASELGVTVRLLATFTNGFIYGYVDGTMNSFERYDRQVARQTAIKMARLHRMRLADGMLNPEPAVYRFVGRSGDLNAVSERRVQFDKKMAESEFEGLRVRLPRYSSLCAEYERLHDLVLERDAYGPACFCHNDLNMSNLLIDRKTKEPIFIDFEWVGVIWY